MIEADCRLELKVKGKYATWWKRLLVLDVVDVMVLKFLTIRSKDGYHLWRNIMHLPHTPTHTQTLTRTHTRRHTHTHTHTHTKVFSVTCSSLRSIFSLREKRTGSITPAVLSAIFLILSSPTSKSSLENTFLDTQKERENVG